MADNEKEWREAFSLFDRTGEGYIKTSDLGTILRALGKCPTEAELSSIISEINSDKLDFDKFIPIISMFNKDNQTASEEIRDAFKLFDPEGKGRISTEQVRTILITMEDKLDLKDIDPILQQADDNGFLSVDMLINALLS